MTFYEVEIHSQPIFKFACATTSDSSEGTQNIIDHRPRIIELSISESIDYLIETEWESYFKPKNTVGIFMPDCKYTIKPVQTDIVHTMSSIAVEVADMQYTRHSETDPERILEILGSCGERTLLLPQVYEPEPEEVPLLMSLFKSLINCYLIKTPASYMRSLAKCYEICAMIDSGFRKKLWTEYLGMSESQASSSYFYVYKIKKYIASHLAEKIKISDIAENLQLSADYVSKLFKSEAGTSIVSYINTQRVQQLCELINTNRDMPVSKLAASVGLNDFRYTQRLFKKYMGVSIRRYKQINNGLSMYHTNPWKIKNLDRDILDI